MKVRHRKAWHVFQLSMPFCHFKKLDLRSKTQCAAMMTGDIGVVHNMQVVTDSEVAGLAPYKVVCAETSADQGPIVRSELVVAPPYGRSFDPQAMLDGQAEDRYIAMLDHRHERGGGL